jgi:Amt family ammonium transporter
MAAIAGGFTAMLVMWLKFGKPDASMTANGMLAGLVSITAPAAFVEAWAALIIGAIGGALVVLSVLFVERKLKVDDPCGAISVHGTCGLWGVLSLGLLADGTYGIGWNGVGAMAVKGVTGLFFGDASQLLAQLIGIVTVIVWAFGLSYIFFKILEMVVSVIDTIIKSAQTGEIGDGKIFVYNIEEAVRIRTGEKGLSTIERKGD